MGQKVNPIGLRLGINRTWDSRWFADGGDYGRLLHGDIKVRKELNAKLEDGKVSVNDMVIKAASLALRKVPAANASWTEAAIRRYKWVDMSVAVAIDDGLITPIIRRADQKGLSEIAAEMKDLAARARAGKLKPVDLYCP